MTASTTFSLALANEAATAHLMADLALLIGPGDVITLTGDLGAGKTAAARALIRYLAADDGWRCRARPSRWRKATISPRSRCCTPTSTASIIPTSSRKSDWFRCQTAWWR